MLIFLLAFLDILLCYLLTTNLITYFIFITFLISKLIFILIIVSCRNLSPSGVRMMESLIFLPFFHRFYISHWISHHAHLFFLLNYFLYYLRVFNGFFTVYASFTLCSKVKKFGISQLYILSPLAQALLQVLHLVN